MNRWKAAALVLVGVGVGFSGSAIKTATAEPPPMEQALHHLHEAKENLEHAAHDHGGHRTKALDRTREAIQQVEEGLAWARDHH
ncbi:MAG TPA: hypothetical protein VGL13_01045 [Polyangiaceae bacterium]|jgi:hypothetical protein